MSTAVRVIVVGITEVQGAPHLAHALDLSKSLGAALHVVRAYQTPDPTLYPDLESSVFSADSLQQVRIAAQQRLQSQVAAVADRDDITCHAFAGPSALAVLSIADEVNADLVMVGATRRGRLARAVLGSTAQRVVRNSKVPVLVTGRSVDDYRRVLLSTDLSAVSTAVSELGIEFATATARSGGFTIRAIAVTSYDPPMVVPDQGGKARSTERLLGEFIAAVRTRTQAELEGVVRTGDPAHEILCEVEDWKADLLVLGTHGRGGAMRFMIGSVAESVLRGVECDVLVVPAAAVASDPGPVVAGS